MFAKKKLLQPVLSRLIKSTFTQIHHLRFFFLGHSHFWIYLLTFLGCCAALHILFWVVVLHNYATNPRAALLLASFVNYASTRCINKEICHQAYVWTHTQCAIHHPLKQNIAHGCHNLWLIAIPIAYPLFYQLSIISPNIRPSSHAITHCLLLSLSALVLVYRQVTQAAQVARQSSISGGTKGHTSCTVPWSGSSTT